MMLPMPTSTSLPMVQPCRVTWWPMVTCLPITSGAPSGSDSLRWLTCSMAKSCTLLPSPIVMRLTSPRTTAHGHTDTLAASSTSPITTAAGSI
ncbi:hypothetical protein D3C78_1781800 [compost metagenome]